MKYNIRLYNRLHKLLPKRYRKWVESYLAYSNIDVTPEMFVGFSILYSISLAFASIFLIVFGIIQQMYLLPTFFAVFITFEVFMHAILIVVSDSRAKVVEEILPDVLRLLSANLRSGLTIDKALLVSARPEFGPLEKKLKTASKETLSGATIENALFKISQTFNSKILARAIDLLSEGINRGGNLPTLLENLGDDIRQMKTLKKEIGALVTMYVIFIFFASGIGAPLLYAISGFLVQTMSKMGSDVGARQALGTVRSRLPISTFQVELEPAFLDTYSLTAMVITSVFGGLLIGLVQDGSERAGLRFIPILLVLSIGVYYMSKIIVAQMLGGVLP